MITSPRPGMHWAAKIAVSGGFGVGKTTFIGTISEVVPLRTEEIMTEASAEADDLTGLSDKASTTVAMDFGRITVDERLVLFLFGTPGQARFWFMWDEISRGAIGAVILTDTRRLADAFPAMDYFDNHRVPYAITVNTFPDTTAVDEIELRDALSVDDTVPVLTCDARDRTQVQQVLVRLVEYAIDRHRATQPAAVHRSAVTTPR